MSVRPPPRKPETRNVVALFDRYPRPHWFVDVHSHVPATFYSWGFDENQTSDPAMNFHNPAFDGKRGSVDNLYREFIPQPDLQALKQLGARINAAVTAVNGATYDLSQSFALYPTSGTSDDYAYTRHFIDNGRSKILSFTIECGRSFQPSWTEAEDIIREVCAGLSRSALPRGSMSELSANPYSGGRSPGEAIHLSI